MDICNAIAFTTTQLRKRWQVGRTKIEDLIRGGHLRAFDAAMPGSLRPRWRIPADAVAEYEASRAACVKRTTRPSRPRTEGGSVRTKYFPE